MSTPQPATPLQPATRPVFLGRGTNPQLHLCTAGLAPALELHILELLCTHCSAADVGRFACTSRAARALFQAIWGQDQLPVAIANSFLLAACSAEPGASDSKMECMVSMAQQALAKGAQPFLGHDPNERHRYNDPPQTPALVIAAR